MNYSLRTKWTVMGLLIAATLGFPVLTAISVFLMPVGAFFVCIGWAAAFTVVYGFDLTEKEYALYSLSLMLCVIGCLGSLGGSIGVAAIFATFSFLPIVYIFTYTKRRT